MCTLFTTTATVRSTKYALEKCLFKERVKPKCVNSSNGVSTQKWLGSHSLLRREVKSHVCLALYIKLRTYQLHIIEKYVCVLCIW